MKRQYPWLLVVILIALALRLFRLGEQSLWYDEGVTWWLATMPPLQLIRWTAADIQPPLYYLLLWLSRALFGSSEAALRFPSVVFNVLTVPLLYTLARRLFPASPKARTAGLLSAPHLAAALGAIAPLMVYYSQEARMYTLLVFEASLTSYLLLRLLDSPNGSRGAGEQGSRGVRRAERGASQEASELIQNSKLKIQNSKFSPSILYALAATAALYTHYFAVFLLAAHALYALVILARRRFPWVIIQQLVGAAGLIILLIAPWLPILGARLHDDPSYWPGALKLDEALRKVIISFSLGETVFEQTGFWLALGYLALLAGAVAGGWRRRSTLFLLLWLLLPVGLVLALSYQSPKFNPRYTLLAWPAFALLLAGGLARLLANPTPFLASLVPPARSRPWRHSPLYALRTTLHALRFPLFSLCVFFIIYTTTFSLYNWYTDRRFAKADFKALAQFVRERQAADETVLLSSGHFFPVWAYYYGWEGWTPLPRMERLDVSRVTGLGIAADLAPALKGKGGAWLVSWQDEVIDPNGVVPFWLDLVGRRPGDAGDFQGVRLEHWRLERGKLRLLAENPIRRPVQLNFAGQVDLLGATQLSDTDLALFWQPRQPLPADLTLSLDLTDQDGFDWDRGSQVGRPGAYLYPPSRWPVGQVTLTRHTLAWQAGTPPGPYVAEVGLGLPGGTEGSFTGWDILDEQGHPSRRTALLAGLNLSRLVPFEPPPAPLDEAPLVDFRPILSLRSSTLSAEAAEPGDRLLLRLLWQAGEFNLDDVALAFDLVDARQQTFRVGTSPTPSRRFSLPLWNPGDLVLGQYWLDLPPQAAAGPAGLRLHLVNGGAFAYDEVFPFARLEVLPATRVFTPPAHVELPLAADFSGQVSLLGAAGAPWRISAGQTISLTLTWQAHTRPATNYTVFTHLLDPANTVVVNADHAPPKPTRGWVPGEVVADPVSLAIPTGLPAGVYTLEIGLYDAADPAFTRLPLTTGETRVILPRPVEVVE